MINFAIKHLSRNIATLAIDPQYTNKNAPRRVAEFSEKVRSIENFGLEKGDRFIIPINYEIWEKDLNGTTVQYIEVPILNAIPDGIVKHLYPSVFRKKEPFIMKMAPRQGYVCGLMEVLLNCSDNLDL